MRAQPAFMVAGHSSGCGKTTLTLALLAALRRRGLQVQACKAGPDFIDPAHHAALTGRPSYNLDSWMGETPGPDLAQEMASGLQRSYACALRPLQSSPVPSIVCVEGVMGLFDGASSPKEAGGRREGAGSSAAVARLLGLPIVLVLNVRGMAQSVAAMAEGFLHYAPDLRFVGLVCSHVGGPRHQKMLREALSGCSVPLLGLLPRQGAPELPSRHLGLLLPHEVDVQADTLAHWLEAHCDLDLLLQRVRALNTRAALPAPFTGQTTGQSWDQSWGQSWGQSWDQSWGHTAGPFTGQSTAHSTAHSTGQTTTQSPAQPLQQRPTALPLTQARAPAMTGPAKPQPPSIRPQRPPAQHGLPTIAIAHDRAFCFLYPDFPDVLQELGARTVFFSPLDASSLPPDCQALYFPGGYPELHAEALSRNRALRGAVAHFARQGGTLYGECGGYMYLMQSIATASGVWPMSGCLPCACQMQEQRAALGYRQVRPASAAFWGCDTVQARGHEYHYATSMVPAWPTPAASPAQPGAPLWQVEDAAGRPLPPEGLHCGKVAGSWVHLYPQGSRALLTHFIQGLA